MDDRSCWLGFGPAGATPQRDAVRRTFTIVTTSPNETMAEIHNRMPVMLDDHEWATWLDPQTADTGELLALLEPRDGPELRITAVSQLVNNVRNDGPELVVPIGA